MFLLGIFLDIVRISMGNEANNFPMDIVLFSDQFSIVTMVNYYCKVV